jgi:hypothetical protein
MSVNYTVVLPIERDFDRVNWMKWMETNWVHSLTMSVIYCVLIYAGQKIMAHRKAFTLDRPLFYWNTFLAVFSIIGLVRMTPEFFFAIYSRGFHYSICNLGYGQGVAEFWTFMFVVSKALELIDTGFIVLRKRPIIFLHVYHHITVMVYCWHGYKDDAAAGRWFMCMNYFVHSIMYSYYASRSIGVKLPSYLPMTITTLQLTQMVVGCYVSTMVYLTKRSQVPCHQTFENLYFCFFIYFTYFLLFAKFFYKAYIEKGNRYRKEISNGVKKEVANGVKKEE